MHEKKLNRCLKAFFGIKGCTQKTSFSIPLCYCSNVFVWTL